MSSAVCLPAMHKFSLFLRSSSVLSSIEGRLPKGVFVKGCLPLKVVFRQLSSSVNGRLPLKVVFRQRLSSVKGCLPSKVVFRQRSCSIEGCLPLKVIFHRRLSSIEGHLPSKVVFHQKLSSIKDCLQSMVVFHFLSAMPMLVPTLQYLVRFVCNTDACANLTTPSRISGVPEPLSEASILTDQKPRKKRPDKTQTIK